MNSSIRETTLTYPRDHVRVTIDGTLNKTINNNGNVFRRFLLLILLSSWRNRNHALHVSSTSSKTSSKATPLTRGTVNDVVSKNITMVLENLLMNYENNQLPTHGKGKETMSKLWKLSKRKTKAAKTKNVSLSETLRIERTR